MSFHHDKSAIPSLYHEYQRCSRIWSTKNEGNLGRISIYSKNHKGPLQEVELKRYERIARPAVRKWDRYEKQKNVAQTPKRRGLYIILGENVASATQIILTEIQFEAMFYGGPKANGDRRETGKKRVRLNRWPEGRMTEWLKIYKEVILHSVLQADRKDAATAGYPVSPGIISGNNN